jgi:hypothetical protein
VSPKVAEVCLIANLQTQGPVYIADAVGDIFDPTSGMLLAARIIITAGMGNSASPFQKLHGPVPIPELEKETNFECYFFIDELHQQPLPSASFSTGRGSYIVCVIISEDIKKDLRDFESQIEVILQEKSAKIDFSESISGEITITIQEDVRNRLHEIYDEINACLDLQPLFQGGSLFDVGLLATLPEDYANVAKKLILHPKGILESEIKDNKILKKLHSAGLITKDKRNGEDWIIPR